MGGGAKDAGRRRSEKQALGAAQGLCRKSKTRENDAPKSADQSAAYAGRVKKSSRSGNESFLIYFRFLSSHTTVRAVRHTAV